MHKGHILRDLLDVSFIVVDSELALLLILGNDGLFDCLPLGLGQLFVRLGQFVLVRWKAPIHIPPWSLLIVSSLLVMLAEPFGLISHLQMESHMILLLQLGQLIEPVEDLLAGERVEEFLLNMGSLQFPLQLLNLVVPLLLLLGRMHLPDMLVLRFELEFPSFKGLFDAYSVFCAV